MFDLIVAAIRGGDVPADFEDAHVETGPGSAHHGWAGASAVAYNLHHLARGLPRHRDAVNTPLAAEHRIDDVAVETAPLAATDVLAPLTEIKAVSLSPQ